MILFLKGDFYFFDGALGAAMGAPSPAGSAGYYGFWMEPTGDGCTGYLVPGWLAGSILVDYVKTSGFLCLFIFRWLIFISTLSGP